MPGFGDLRKIEAHEANGTSTGAAAFVESFGFVIFFLILILFIYMVFGERVVYPFLWLVLLGMVFTNWSKIDEIMRRYV